MRVLCVDGSWRGLRKEGLPSECCERDLVGFMWI
jgi:hypothetical protein